MNEQSSKLHKRLTTTLGVAIAAALSPSGKIISSAVASGVVAVAVTGYAIHEHKPPPHSIHASIAAPGTPAYLADAGPFSTVFTDIESDGHEIHVLLTMSTGKSGGHGSTPKLWVTGWAIGGANNPNKSFQRLGPASGAALPHGGSPDFPPKQSGLSPDAKNPALPLTITEIVCSKEDKLLGKCDASSEETAANDGTETGASNPPTPPPTGEKPSSGPDNHAGEHPIYNPADTGGSEGTDPVQPNVALLDHLLTKEFSGDDFIPPSKIEPKQTEERDNEENEQPLVMRLGLIPTAVPEPSAISLMLLGVAAMGWAGRRRTAPPKQPRG